MNTALLIGNLTRDPELRYTSGGKAIAEFSIAVNKGSGENRTTTFIRCEAWEKTAEYIAERARKGGKVFVEGELKVDTWNDKETGKRREKMIVNVRSITVMTGVDFMQEVAFEPTPNVPQSKPTPRSDEEEENFDDLPF